MYDVLDGLEGGEVALLCHLYESVVSQPGAHSVPTISSSVTSSITFNSWLNIFINYFPKRDENELIPEMIEMSVRY